MQEDWYCQHHPHILATVVGVPVPTLLLPTTTPPICNNLPGNTKNMRMY